MEHEEQAETVVLARSLGVAQAADLADRLYAARGTSLKLDAGEVEHLGGQCLQLLIAAKRSWATDGQAFRIVNSSESLERDLALLGYPELLGEGCDGS